MRPMVLEFPEDPAVAYLDRQYMLGPDLLVAPVMSASGEVTFYVPAGTWTSVLTGARLVGPGWVTEKHDVDSIPLLARPGAVIPFGAVDDRPDYAWADDVELRLFAPSEGQVSRVRVPVPTTVAGSSDSAEFEVTYDGNGAHARLIQGSSAGFSCVAVGAGEG
jgi:alpha-D-xyloside xylohydrolase